MDHNPVYTGSLPMSSYSSLLEPDNSRNMYQLDESVYCVIFLQRRSRCYHINSSLPDGMETAAPKGSEMGSHRRVSCGRIVSLLSLDSGTCGMRLGLMIWDSVCVASIIRAFHLPKVISKDPTCKLHSLWALLNLKAPFLICGIRRDCCGCRNLVLS